MRRPLAGDKAGNGTDRTTLGAGRTWRIPALLAAGLTLAASVAEAQERRTIIDMLFGTRRQQPMPDWTVYPPPPPPARGTQRPRSPAAGPAAPAETAPVAVVEKRADARKVLVIGDFLASGLGDGLTEAFAEAPGVAIVSRPNGSSGLVREDYHDWQRELPRLLDEEKPAAVVVLIGSNDRQPLRLGQGYEKFGSEEWLAEYARRAEALAALANARKTPLLWVGLPPFQSPSMTADAVTLNRILRGAAEKSGGLFVDIWDGFADEAGKFVTTGSDINGKPVRLRGTDGVGLTRAGKRKLAFYLEKPVRNLLGEEDGAATDGLRLDSQSLPDLLSLSPSGQELPVKTMPLAITDPDLDGGSELLGAKALPARHVLSPRDLLVERGELPPAPPGRADSATPDRTTP